MLDSVIQLRNSLTKGVYKYLLKPVFFRNDPEFIHDAMVSFGEFIGRFWILKFFLKITYGYKSVELKQNILGINFDNPIGLSAGFDKDARLMNVLPSIGFGFEEVGSVTGNYCEGNPKPRLWRMPKSKGLLVYYGLKNRGADKIAESIGTSKYEFPVGVSVAMTNCKANLDIQNAIDDFAKAFRIMESKGDYVTINISCPNTLGGQPFIDKNNLDQLLARLDTIETRRPVFIKLSPDLNNDELDGLLDVLKSHRVHGVICANLTKKRDNPKIIENDLPLVGGVSGEPVREISNNMISHIYKREGDRFVIVGCGGVFSAEDAYNKIKLGASLVQMITGLIYEGPQVISEINRGLVGLLKRDGYKNIEEARGVEARV